MADPKLLARFFIGIAALAPAIALAATGVVLALRGGTLGVLAGLFLIGLGLGLVVVAILMMRAPEAAQWFLGDRGRDEEHEAGSNGHN